MSWATPKVDHIAGGAFDYVAANRIESNILWLGGDGTVAKSTDAATAYALCKRDSLGGLSVAALTAASLTASGAIGCASLTASVAIGCASLTALGAIGCASLTVLGAIGVSGNLDVGDSITTKHITVTGNAGIDGYLTVNGQMTGANLTILGAVGVAQNLTSGTLNTGAFGCNGKAAQGAYASGGALAAPDTSYVYTKQIALVNLANNIRSALVANGIMS